MRRLVTTLVLFVVAFMRSHLSYSIKKDVLKFTYLQKPNCIIQFPQGIEHTDVIPNQNFRINGVFSVRYKDISSADDVKISFTVKYGDIILIDMMESLRKLLEEVTEKEFPTFPLAAGMSYNFSLGAMLPDSIANGLYHIQIRGARGDDVLFVLKANFLRVLEDTPVMLRGSLTVPHVEENTKKESVPIPNGAFALYASPLFAMGAAILLLAFS